MSHRRDFDPTRPPNARQLQVLAALVAHGTYRRAAEHLGISAVAIKSALERMRLDAGVSTTEQLVYVGARAGWLSVPELDEGESL